MEEILQEILKELKSINEKLDSKTLNIDIKESEMSSIISGTGNICIRK